MRFVSIVGDSISTYEGYNPQGYSVFYNEEMQNENGLKSVYDTWWAKVNQALQGLLCVNNSYSGSKVSGGSFPAATSEQRMNMLKTKEFSPDYILIYVGFNDFGNGVPVSKSKDRNILGADYNVFEEAYDIMLQKIISRNPVAKIICGTIMRTEIRGRNDWEFPEYYAGIGLEDYNSAIRRVAEKNNCIVADISRLGIRYETLDGSHPTSTGHMMIADAWIRCLAELNLLKPSIETCIKMYNANKDNNICFNMVLQALLEERVLMMFDESGRLVGINDEGKILIPIFTSPNEVKYKDSAQMRTVLLYEYIEKVKSLKRDLLVNPFSPAGKQCVIPYVVLDKLSKDKIKIITETDYDYFFPKIIPISLKKYANIVGKYSPICYSLYHNWLLQYLINKLQLKKYDNLICYSDLKFKTISPENMDIYQYLASDYLKYFYLRNNLHLDNLSQEELEFLVKFSINKNYSYDEEKEKFVEATYQKVIFDDILGNKQIVSINYGPQSRHFFAPNNAIIIGVRYNELYNIGMTDDEWDELHDKQMDALSDILNLCNVENQNALYIPYEIIIYNDFSVRKR